MLSPAPVSFLPEVLITPLSTRHGIGLDGVAGMGNANATSGAWFLGNGALYYPIYIDRPGLVTKFFTMNGATASGNMDIGLYRKDYTLIVAKGSTAQAGTNVLQEYDVTDFWIARGAYFLGLLNSGTTGTIFRTGIGSALYAGVMGITQQSVGSTALPATATPAAVTASTSPVHVAGFAFRALVA